MLKGGERFAVCKPSRRIATQEKAISSEYVQWESVNHVCLHMVLPLIGAMWVKLADQGSADYLWKGNIVGYILLIPGNRVQS